MIESRKKEGNKNHFVQWAFSKTIERLAADKTGWPSMCYNSIAQFYVCNNIFHSKWRKAKVCIKTVSWINKLRKQKVFNVLFHFKKWNVMALILLFPFAYADATHSTLSHHQIFMDLMHDEQIKIWMNKRNKTLQPFHCNPILSIHWRFRSFVISSFRFFFSFYWVC